MNTTVSNVKKDLVLSFPKSVIETKMKYLCTNSEYYKSFDDSESLLGLYKYYFKKPISGLVDTGMQVHITLCDEGENKTKVTIEVVDNWGGTDGFDIDSSNILMTKVTKSLNHIIKTDDEELSNTNKPQEAKEEDKGISTGGVVTIIAIVVIALFIMLI